MNWLIDAAVAVSILVSAWLKVTVPSTKSIALNRTACTMGSPR
ncbi:Uncharacterised protein [Mycobacterium tuberculosis]|nr:Uncharacterised protein [Mycobacterium tuberculosis]